MRKFIRRFRRRSRHAASQSTPPSSMVVPDVPDIMQTQAARRRAPANPRMRIMSAMSFPSRRVAPDLSQASILSAPLRSAQSIADEINPRAPVYYDVETDPFADEAPREDKHQQPALPPPDDPSFQALDEEADRTTVEDDDDDDDDDDDLSSGTDSVIEERSKQTQPVVVSQIKPAIEDNPSTEDGDAHVPPIQMQDDDSNVPPNDLTPPLIRDRPIEESPFHPVRLPRNSATSRGIETEVYNAYLDALISQARDGSHGLHTIVNALREDQANPVIIEHAALAISMLAEDDAATRDFLGKFNAVEWLIQCLSVRLKPRYDDTLIASRVVRAIANLLRGSPRNVDIFEEFDGPRKMGKAAASKRYQDAPEIPKYALQALSELKYHPRSVPGFLLDKPNGSSESSRIAMYVLQSMAIHQHREDVQERGLDALRTLLARSSRESFSNKVLSLSARAAATACRLYSDSSEIQWQCLMLFCDLDQMRDVFALEWDVECFFKALGLLVARYKESKQTTHSGEDSLLALIRRATGIASSLGWRNKEAKDKAVEAGAIEIVLEALENCGEDADTVNNICTILRILLHSNEGQYRLKHVNAVCTILAGIEVTNIAPSEVAHMYPATDR